MATFCPFTNSICIDGCYNDVPEEITVVCTFFREDEGCLLGKIADELTEWLRHQNAEKNQSRSR